MRVSELKPGMLLRPKDGYVFVRYSESQGRHEHFESRRPRELSREQYLRQGAFSNKPVIYVCRRPNVYDCNCFLLFGVLAGLRACA